jgi:hypothetical protein
MLNSKIGVKNYSSFLARSIDVLNNSYKIKIHRNSQKLLIRFEDTDPDLRTYL